MTLINEYFKPKGNLILTNHPNFLLENLVCLAKRIKDSREIADLAR
jgi:hypothetical protein